MWIDNIIGEPKSFDHGMLGGMVKGSFYTYYYITVWGDFVPTRKRG